MTNLKFSFRLLGVTASCPKINMYWVWKLSLLFFIFCLVLFLKETCVLCNCIVFCWEGYFGGVVFCTLKWMCHGHGQWLENIFVLSCTNWKNINFLKRTWETCKLKIKRSNLHERFCFDYSDASINNHIPCFFVRCGFLSALTISFSATLESDIRRFTSRSLLWGKEAQDMFCEPRKKHTFRLRMDPQKNRNE